MSRASRANAVSRESFQGTGALAPTGGGNRAVGLRRAEQIPPVSSDIYEHRYPSVVFRARLSDELDPSSEHLLVGLFKVLDSEKEPDPSCNLIPDRLRLVRSIGTSEQDSRLRVRRTHDNPPLRPAIIGERRRIFYQRKTEHLDEEVDRRVVLVYDDRDQLHERHGI